MTSIITPQILAKLILGYGFVSKIIITVSITIAKIFIKPKANIVSIKGAQHLIQVRP